MDLVINEYVLVILNGRVVDHDGLSIEENVDNVVSIGNTNQSGFTNYQIDLVMNNLFSIHKCNNPTLIIYTSDTRYRFEECQLDTHQARFSPNGKKYLASFWAAGPSEMVNGWKE